MYPKKEKSIKTPSAHEGLIHLYTKPSFHLSYFVLYQSVNQRWSLFAHGCNGCGVFWLVSPFRPSDVTRVIRLQKNWQTKKPLLLPSVETLKWKPRAKAWVTAFQSVAFHGNEYILNIKKGTMQAPLCKNLTSVWFEPIAPLCGQALGLLLLCLLLFFAVLDQFVVKQACWLQNCQGFLPHPIAVG